MQRTKFSCYHLNLLIFRKISLTEFMMNSYALTGAPVATYGILRKRGSGMYFRKRSIPSFTDRRLSEWRTLLRTCFLHCLLICHSIIS